MTPRRVRRRAPLVLVVAAVATIGGAVIVSSGVAAAAGPAFTLSGSVNGLYPGRTVELAVEVQNPRPFRLAVNTADVSVGDASSACDASNLVAQGFAGSVEVNPNATATVPLELHLLDTAPDSCQGATFPLTFRATGLLETPAPSPAGPFGMLPFTGLGWTTSLLAAGGLCLLLVGLALVSGSKAGIRRRTVP